MYLNNRKNLIYHLPIYYNNIFLSFYKKYIFLKFLKKYILMIIKKNNRYMYFLYWLTI